jgi:signal transduction histidine kinase
MSLRWRLMVIGGAGLSIGLFAGGWLLLAALGLALDRSVDASASRTASDVAGLIDAGQLPQPVPVAGFQLVQVVDAQNRVRAGSPGVDRLVPILDPAELRHALTGQHLQVGGYRAGRSGPLRISARSAGPATDRLAIVVAVPMDDAVRAMRAMRLALLGVFLPFVAVLAAIAWWVIGRTLQPVEALRAGAEGITGQGGAGADERLPVPAGADEIHRLAVTLNGMLDRLAAGRRRQRQFVADAAHELRNPLAGMRTQLEVAKRHPASTDWEELTEDLLADTEQLAAMAEDLLLLAGSDETALSQYHEQRRAVIGDVLAGLLARYRDARVPVRASSGLGAGWAVSWHPADLHRLMTNLVDNAIRHARSGVWLDAGLKGDQVWITVTDDGPGIPETDRERVFGRFVRLDDARTRDAGGAGLGLAIVAELLRRYGGTIDLTDAGQGLRAEILLPAARDVHDLNRDVKRDLDQDLD